MTNPFRLRWLQGWTFLGVLMDGAVQVEAQGFGIRLRTAMLPGESPQAAADRLVLAEDQRRRALHHAWLRGQSVTDPCHPLLSRFPDLALLCAHEYCLPSTIHAVDTAEGVRRD